MTGGSERGLHRLPPEAVFVFAAVSQYTGIAIAVSLFEALGAPAVAWLRVVGAAMILLVWTRPWRRAWSRAALARAAALGSSIALMNLVFYVAIDHLPLGTAVAIEFIGPIGVAALATRTPRDAAALAIAVCGVLLLANVSSEGSEPVGVFFALLSALSWVAYILIGKRVADAGAPVEALGVGLVAGALLTSPAGVGKLGIAIASPHLLALALLTAVLSNAVPYALDVLLMTRMSAGRFALLLTLYPVTASAIGIVALQQVPTAGELAGVGLVVLALAVRAREG